MPELFIKSIGPLEAIIILAIVLVVFGVGRLPEVGGAVGKAIRNFRHEVKVPEEEKPAQAEGKRETPTGRS